MHMCCFKLQQYDLHIKWETHLVYVYMSKSFKTWIVNTLSQFTSLFMQDQTCFEFPSYCTYICTCRFTFTSLSKSLLLVLLEMLHTWTSKDYTGTSTCTFTTNIQLFILGIHVILKEHWFMTLCSSSEVKCTGKNLLFGTKNTIFISHMFVWNAFLTDKVCILNY